MKPDAGGRPDRKKQLRIDEARKLVDLCLRKANEGDEAAVGVLTAFLLGLRTSEVTDRVVRDLDDNGRLLWIEFGKTRRARRTLEAPALLRPYLLALAKGRAPDAQLISRTISRHSGKKRDRYWLAHHVERLCTDAGVPVVCTQSLRGLHASVATEAGATSHVVASALGHSSPAVTHAHYIDGDTARRTRTRRVIGTVAPDPALRGVPILIRGDSGFASPDMYVACQKLKVDFLLGMGPNSRLKKTAARSRKRPKRRFLRTNEKARLFTSTRYRARRRWPRSYRVLIKAEHESIGANVRFVVTTLPGRAQELYDECYVERAEACENSIKDLKNVLKADRLSCHRFWANQFRLLLHAAAYVLMYELRRAAHGTELEQVQMDTLRLRLLKVGVQVASTARRIWFHLSSSHPWQAVWSLIAWRLVHGPDG